MAVVLKEVGLFRANLNADDSNFLKLADCDECGENVVCQDFYSGTHAATVLVTGVSIDGVVTTFDTGIRVDNPAAVEAAVLALLGMEINPYVDASYSGTTFTFTHWGAARVVIYVATLAKTMVIKCNVGGNCDYVLFVGEASSDELAITSGGTGSTLANSPYTWTGVALTDEATRAQLATDMGTALTALSITGYVVTVATDNANEGFIVTVNHASPLSLWLGTEGFAQQNCIQTWIA